MALLYALSAEAGIKRQQNQAPAGGCYVDAHAFLAGWAGVVGGWANGGNLPPVQLPFAHRSFSPGPIPPPRRTFLPWAVHLRGGWFFWVGLGLNPAALLSGEKRPPRPFFSFS